jgi:hypothetical protein
MITPQNYVGNIEQWRLVDRFDSTYWSGKDVKVYFDNIRIREAVQVSYQVLEQIMPVYHYSDYVPTRMVQGQRLVVGEITTNFKRDGYLYSLIKALADEKDTRWLDNGRSREVNKPAQTLVTEYGLLGYSDQSVADLKQGKYKGKDLKKIVETIYEKNLQSSDYGAFSPDVNNRQPMFFTGLEGFNLTLVFGSQLKNEQILRYNANGDAYPDITNTREPRTDQRVATGKSIISVYLGGSSTVVDDSGRPIMETLTFQAKNVQVLDIKDLEIN